MIRSTKDLLAGLIYIFFGASAILIARDYQMGTAFKMGPAYFPTVLSVLLIVVDLDLGDPCIYSSGDADWRDFAQRTGVGYGFDCRLWSGGARGWFSDCNAAAAFH